MGPTLKDLRDSPESVKDGVGYALELVQKGEKPANAKPLKGFGGASVLEIVRISTGTLGVRSIRWRSRMRSTCCTFFQKKSKKGIATPKKELDLIKRRLRDAIEHGKGE
jgi:phage-related protein